MFSGEKIYFYWWYHISVDYLPNRTSICRAIDRIALSKVELVDDQMSSRAQKLRALTYGSSGFISHFLVRRENIWPSWSRRVRIWSVYLKDNQTSMVRMGWCSGWISNKPSWALLNALLAYNLSSGVNKVLHEVNPCAAVGRRLISQDTSYSLHTGNLDSWLFRLLRREDSTFWGHH